MSLELNQEASGRILFVRIHGKLTKGHYEHFVPEVERLIGDPYGSYFPVAA